MSPAMPCCGTQAFAVPHRPNQYRRSSRQLSMSKRIGLIGVILVVLSGCVERMFFYPDAVPYTTPAQLHIKAEDVYVSTGNGSRLHGWFLPATGAGNTKGTVLH